MNCHQILSGACNAGDRCFAVGSVEGIPFTVSVPDGSRRHSLEIINWATARKLVANQSADSHYIHRYTNTSIFAYIIHLYVQNVMSIHLYINRSRPKQENKV